MRQVWTAAPIAIIVVAGLGVAMPLPAADITSMPAPHTRIDANTGLPIPCRCRHAGSLYDVGQTVCLILPEGRRWARCARFDNVTTWTIVSEGCEVGTAPSGSLGTTSIGTHARASKSEAPGIAPATTETPAQPPQSTTHITSVR